MLRLLTSWLFIFCFSQSSIAADQVAIAVASNFSVPMRSIIQEFESASGHSVRVSFASTGKLYAQIINGAPFDILLSADQAAPKKMLDSGVALTGTRRSYAIGQLVLWSNDGPEAYSAQERLIRKSFNKVAIANPRFAPYGLAAAQVLEKLQLTNETPHALVYGENIAQVYQFVKTANADLGFIAASQIVGQQLPKRVKFWLVPQSLHEPITQDMVLLARSKGNSAARSFFAFMQTEQVEAIIKRHGYRVPGGVQKMKDTPNALREAS